MEGLYAEQTAGIIEQRVIRPEADVAPGIIVELVEGVGQTRRRVLEGRVGEFARAFDDRFEGEARRLCGWIFGLGPALGESPRDEAGLRRAGRSESAEQLTACEFGHFGCGLESFAPIGFSGARLRSELLGRRQGGVGVAAQLTKD